MPEEQGRSIGELFSALGSELSTLVRQEIALAKVEFTEKAKRVGANTGQLAVGGAIGYAAFLAFLAAVIMLLADVMPWWAAALLVAAATGIVAFLMVSKALTALKRTDLKP